MLLDIEEYTSLQDFTTPTQVFFMVRMRGLQTQTQWNTSSKPTVMYSGGEPRGLLLDIPYCFDSLQVCVHCDGFNSECPSSLPPFLWSEPGALLLPSTLPDPRLEAKGGQSSMEYWPVLFHPGCVPGVLDSFVQSLIFYTCSTGRLPGKSFIYGRFLILTLLKNEINN